MRCKRGYTGDNCLEEAEPVVRKNILSMNDSEKQDFVDLIKNVKSSSRSGYVVPIREPVTTNPRESFVEISLYNIFATFHFNSIRDQDNKECDFCKSNTADCQVPDFAHQGPTFLTWHRAYMLYVETELQRFTNNPTFSLPYWDWTDQNTSEEIWHLMGTSNCGIFQIGNNSNNTNSNGTGCSIEEAPVEGPFEDWDAICANPEKIICDVSNQMCNPTQNFARITRCIGGTAGLQCRVEGTLPTAAEVNVAFTETQYDADPYGKEEDNLGFRNALEGFRYLVERNRDSCTKNFNITELHNRVHLYTGGTMLNVAKASNDPLFFLHHCMIDRLYELWLDQFSDDDFPNYEPSTFNYEISPGHNIDEYLVPLFPLYTNRDMHKRAKNFGYTYDMLETPTSTDAPMSTDAPASTASTDAPTSTDAPASKDAPTSTDAPASKDAPTSTDAPKSTDAANHFCALVSKTHGSVSCVVCCPRNRGTPKLCKCIYRNNAVAIFMHS